jgi:hypothetical protein
LHEPNFIKDGIGTGLGSIVWVNGFSAVLLMPPTKYPMSTESGASAFKSMIS